MLVIIQSYCDRVEGSINNFLRSLKSKSIIDNATYKQLYVTGSGPGILYGLPKVHKANFRDNFPFRPIFAAYKTAPYKLAKFLVPIILAPFTSNKYTVDNSYSFVLMWKIYLQTYLLQKQLTFAFNHCLLTAIPRH